MTVQITAAGYPGFDQFYGNAEDTIRSMKLDNYREDYLVSGLPAIDQHLLEGELSACVTDINAPFRWFFDFYLKELAFLKSLELRGFSSSLLLLLFILLPHGNEVGISWVNLITSSVLDHCEKLNYSLKLKPRKDTLLLYPRVGVPDSNTVGIFRRTPGYNPS